jgi:hypothetical protein
MRQSSLQRLQRLLSRLLPRCCHCLQRLRCYKSTALVSL